MFRLDVITIHILIPIVVVLEKAVVASDLNA